jgi:hypothetical protein
VGGRELGVAEGVDDGSLLFVGEVIFSFGHIFLRVKQLTPAVNGGWWGVAGERVGCGGTSTSSRIVGSG